MDFDCVKKQRERVDGVPQHRCINKLADKHLQIVQDSDCGACPVRILMQKKGCSKALTPVFQLPVLPVIQDGFRACSLRAGKTCSVTGLGVTPASCDSCVGEAQAEAVAAGFTAKALAYVDAVKVWIQKGRPRRSPEEVERIFNDHCKKCFRFDPVANACKSCGCPVAPSGHPLGNKISMATEKCPLGQW